MSRHDVDGFVFFGGLLLILYAGRGTWRIMREAGLNGPELAHIRKSRRKQVVRNAHRPEPRPDWGDALWLVCSVLFTAFIVVGLWLGFLFGFMLWSFRS